MGGGLSQDQGNNANLEFCYAADTYFAWNMVLFWLILQCFSVYVYILYTVSLLTS